MRVSNLIAAFVGAALLAGCVLPPKETPHPQQLENTRLGLDGIAAEPVAESWWSSFQDPQLGQLIELGLKDNPTLAQAQARVAEALAQSESAHSKLLPNVKGSASTFYNRGPENFFLPPPYAGHTFSEGQAGASLGWDLDFFGRQSSALHSAQALAQSARFDEENARLLLAGAIAQTYLELYRQHALADIAERSEAQRQNIVSITQRRVAAGLDTRLELKQAEGQLPQARVSREQAQAAVNVAIHQLAALTGQGADAYKDITRPTLDVDAALPVPTALPINLLARRPDVLSARLTIEAADAQRLSAKAAFYPEISLQAIAGIGAFGLNNLVKWSARGGGVGPVLSLPLFDGGLLRAQYRGSEAQLDSAIDGYNNTVLRAVQQTSDQITQLDALAHERIDQQETLDANEVAYHLAEERYKAGLASYLTVLNAETQVLSARQNTVDILTAQANTRITLLLAVGGSFDPRTTSATLANAGTSSPTNSPLTQSKP
jgi:NodT family efflux transporter outer membrane factor (OMF) lipoprotein